MRACRKYCKFWLSAAAFFALLLAWWSSPSPVATRQFKATTAALAPDDCQPAAEGYPAPVFAAVTAESQSAEASALAVAAGEKLRQWDNDDDPKFRDQRLNELAALLRGADLNRVASMLPDDVLDFALGLPIFKAWIDSHPEQSAAWMSRRADIPEVRVATLIHDWEQSDVAGIEHYFDSLPDGEWRQKILTVIARDSLRGDPSQAIQWADQLDAGPVQTGLLQTAVTNWAGQDPQGAMRWVGAVEDPGLKDQLAASLAVQYARTDPTAAVKYAISEIQSDDLLNGSIANIASVWGQEDPAEAAAWLEQLPEGDARRMAVAQLVNEWANSDPGATAAWISQLPAGPLRDQAAGSIEMLATASSGR